MADHMNASILTYLHNQSRAADVVGRAVVDNCRFDERCSPMRWGAFYRCLEKYIDASGTFGPAEWGEATKEYLDARFLVPQGSVPDAFLDENMPAWLPRIVDQKVVRLEALTLPLSISGYTLEDLIRLKSKQHIQDSHAAYAEFFEKWNSKRDDRPAFCAFPDELDEEMKSEDWPHALRDRLGLGHYPPRGGAPIDVALMMYDLSEALNQTMRRGLKVAAALPGVLDAGMHEFFFPVPREHPYGATLHLQQDSSDILTAEIFHCRIDYKPQHLIDLGQIEHWHGLGPTALRDARDLHLLSLREACNRQDFGELLENRT
jgi:hypothetical protein